MNKKIIKITAIVIAVIFFFGLFTQFAYMFAFATPKDTVIVRKLKAAEYLEQSLKEQSERRLRFMCEKGVGSYMGVIFSSDSISDFVDRIVIANELAEYDKSMIDAVAEVKKELADSIEEQE